MGCDCDCWRLWGGSVSGWGSRHTGLAPAPVPCGESTPSPQPPPDPTYHWPGLLWAGAVLRALDVSSLSQEAMRLRAEPPVLQVSKQALQRMQRWYLAFQPVLGWGMIWIDLLALQVSNFLHMEFSWPQLPLMGFLSVKDTLACVLRVTKNLVHVAPFSLYLWVFYNLSKTPSLVCVLVFKFSDLEFMSSPHPNFGTNIKVLLNTFPPFKGLLTCWFKSPHINWMWLLIFTLLIFE